jgi:hypothetical protein
MKKFALPLILLFLLVIGVSLYRFFSGFDAEPISADRTDEASSLLPVHSGGQVPQEATTGQQRLEANTDLRPLNQDEDEELQLTMEDLELLSEHFDLVEDQWMSIMEALIVTELGESEGVLVQYLALRESYDEQKLLAYEEFHSKLGGQSYHLTAYEEEINQPIQQEYEGRLQTLLGPEGARLYLEARDNFNDELRRNRRSNLPLFLIDF